MVDSVSNCIQTTKANAKNQESNCFSNSCIIPNHENEKSSCQATLINKIIKLQIYLIRTLTEPCYMFDEVYYIVVNR